MQLRYYQLEAISALFTHWRGGGTNPLVVAATGTGKSLIIGDCVRRIVEKKPHVRIVMVVHTQELVTQNAEELRRLMPVINLGINCGSIGRHDTTQKVVYGTIQSMWNKAGLLGHRDLVLVDEAHRIPHGESGTYKKFIAALKKINPALRVAGFTATDYRLDSGRLTEGDDALFEQVVYSYDVADGVRDGFLAPLVSKATQLKLNTAGVAKRGGEFVPSSLQAAVDHDDVTQQAVHEILHWMEAQGRKSVLAFCSGVAHAEHVRDALIAQGLRAGCVTGDTDQRERETLIRKFRDGQLDALTSMDVLTTGFNVKQVDLIALLRPTMSTGLYVQMLGRGTRCIGADIKESIANGKENCLVLDFAGNVRRHGPIDCIEVRAQGRRGEKDTDELGKECPACAAIIARAARVCPECEHVFPPPEMVAKHSGSADESGAIMSDELTQEWQAVDYVGYRTQRGRDGKPDSLMCSYHLDAVTKATTFVRLAHPQGSYPRTLSERWWDSMGGGAPIPSEIPDADECHRRLHQATHVMVGRSGKFLNALRLLVTDGREVWVVDCDKGRKSRSGFKAAERDAALAAFRRRESRRDEYDPYAPLDPNRDASQIFDAPAAKSHSGSWAPAADDHEIAY